MRLRRGKLLRTALLAVTIVAAAHWTADWLGIKYWRPDERLWRANIYAYQRSALAADVLVAGSSRILFGVSAKALQEELSVLPTAPTVYNIAQPAGNALKNAVVLRDVLRSKGCPELVLLEMSPGLVNGALEQKRFVKEYTTLADLPLLAPDVDSISRLDAILTSRLAGPVALYYHWADPPPERMVEAALRRQGSRWGARPPATLRRLDEEIIRRRGKQVREKRLERFLLDFTVRGVPARALETIAEMASGCGAKLILVRLPAMVPPSPETESIDRVLGDYIEEFSQRTGTPYHHIRPEAAGLRPEHFNDFSHLNYEGAERLTRYVAGRILLPALAEASDKASGAKRKPGTSQ